MKAGDRKRHRSIFRSDSGGGGDSDDSITVHGKNRGGIIWGNICLVFVCIVFSIY